MLHHNTSHPVKSNTNTYSHPYTSVKQRCLLAKVAHGGDPHRESGISAVKRRISSRKDRTFALRVTVGRSCSPINLVKLSNKAFWQLATFLSLAIAMQALGFNRAYASNVEDPAVWELSRQVNNSNSVRRGSGFLPKIFNLIASSTKSQPANSGFEIATPKSAPSLRLAPLQPIDRSQKYLADTKSLAKPKPSIHQVKQGETITAIR